MSEEIVLSGNGGSVVLKVRPKISISKSAMYINQGLPGAAGIAVYTVTNNKKYNFNTKFVSRTVEEADENLKYVLLLQSWLMASKYEASKPSIININGYGSIFDNVPTVMTDMNVSYDDESEYISSGEDKMPIILPVSFSLIEKHSSDALKGFDIGAYREGLFGEF